MSGASPVTITDSSTAAYFHREIEGDELLSADRDPLPLERLESREVRTHGIGAGSDSGEDVFANGVADGRARHVCGLVDQCDSGARDDGIRVSDRTAQASLK